MQLHRLGAHRLVEARPAASGVELRAALEELGAARRTGVEAGALLVEQLARPRALGRRLAQHRVLLGAELVPPLVVALGHVVVHRASLSGASDLVSIVAGRAPVPGFVLSTTHDGCPVFRRRHTPRLARRAPGFGCLGCAATGGPTRAATDGRCEHGAQSAYRHRPDGGRSRRAGSARCSRSSARLVAARRRKERGDPRRVRHLGGTATIGCSASSSTRRRPCGTTRCSSSACSACVRRRAEARAGVPSRSADRSTERGPDPYLDTWRRSSPEIGSTRSRTASTGSVRTARRRAAAPQWIAFGWAALATVVLVAARHRRRHAAERSSELRRARGHAVPVARRHRRADDRARCAASRC